MKKLFAFVSILLLAGTLAACSADSTEPTGDTDTKESTLLSVEINPTVEFIVDEDGNVESFNPLNEDAEIVVADLELVGKTYEEALDLYLEEATELGYIDVDADDNAVYISTSEDENTDDEDADQEGEENLEDRAKEKINEHFKNNGILGAAVEKDLQEEYGTIAEEYDIGLGKARLISRAVELDEELTMEEAVEMNMGDIMAILRADHQERMEEFRNERQTDAKAVKDAMKDQVRDKVQKHRDDVEEAKENGEEVGSADFEEIRNNIANRSEEEETANENRMDNIKQKAMDNLPDEAKKNNPFFSDNEDDTTGQEGATDQDGTNS